MRIDSQISWAVNKDLTYHTDTIKHIQGVNHNYYIGRSMVNKYTIILKISLTVPNREPSNKFRAID